jgi:uncharacterized membrane protein YraQ (UPF0718 family)
MQIFLYAITGLTLLISLIASRQKTLRALKMAVRRFLNIMPAFLLMLVLVSVVLFLVPDTFITRYLGVENRYLSVLFASLIGSAVILPGFIAFPLAGVLLTQGVPYMVLSAFTTTLMMVGVLTYPVEKAYMGVKVTIIRNLISFIIALVVAAITGIFFGELFR